MQRVPMTCILIAVSLLLAGLSSPTGCKSSQPSGDLLGLEFTDISRVSLLALQEKLRDFADRFAFSVKGAAVRIVRESNDRNIQKNTVYWKLVTIPNMRTSIYQHSPLIGLVDSWAFCEQMTDFFESPEGRDAFGEWTRVALETSQELVEDIAGIARESINEAYYERWKEIIQQFARENPLRGLFVRYSARSRLLQVSDTGTLSWLTDVPLAPFRAFMSDTAKAVAEMTVVADRMIHMARFFSEEARWQTELLLYDIEDRASTQSALNSLQDLGESSRSLAETARQLPEEFERRVTAVLDVVDEKQEGIQETLREARAALERSDEAVARVQDTLLEAQNTLADTQETIGRVSELSQSAITVSERVSDAGVKWESTLRVLQELVRELAPEPELGPDGTPLKEPEPFDMESMERTADKAHAAVTELRSLNQEVRELLDSGSAGATVGLIVLYLVLLLAAFFVLLLAYRITARRLMGDRPGGAPQS